MAVGLAAGAVTDEFVQGGLKSRKVLDG